MRHVTYERVQTQNAHTCKKNTSFLSHQVSIFTHVRSVHFSAFSMHYPQCKTLPVRTRNSSATTSFRDVTQTRAAITDITLSRMTLAPATIFYPGFGTRS